MSHDHDDACASPELLGGRGGEPLRPGQVGVLMARAGVGKSACLVHLGLDHLDRGLQVLHLALGTSLSELDSSYSLQLERRLGSRDPMSRALRHAEIGRSRLIVVHPDRDDAPTRLRQALRTAREGMGWRPGVILLDGFDWERGRRLTRADVEDLRAAAREARAALWMTVRTHREQTGVHPTTMPAAVAPCADLIDRALFLEPLGETVTVRVLQERSAGDPADEGLVLDSGGLRPAADGRRAGGGLSPERVTLVSGGAQGAEAEFGRCAERWGLAERTFSFAGREPARRRGLVELDEVRLRRGAVSRAWLQARMGRTYSTDPAFQRILQTIWHQVADADEVHAVGAIQLDGTVRGGTGWAVELARLWGKPAFVFDQPAAAWFRWDGERWEQLDATPVIAAARFCGTGTQHLDDRGRRAIDALFRATFGDPPR